MENAPVMIRGAWKRGTYFLKKKPKSTVTPELPDLLHRIKVSVITDKLDVKHDTWDVDDPSNGISVLCENVKFDGTWAFPTKIKWAQSIRDGGIGKVKRYQNLEGIWRKISMYLIYYIFCFNIIYYNNRPKEIPDMENLAVESINVMGYMPETLASHPLLMRSLIL